MNTAATDSSVRYDDADLRPHLDQASDEELDRLDFGVIAFDSEGLVRRYNRFESQAAGLSPQRVLGHHLFTAVAPGSAMRYVLMNRRG